MITYTSSDIIKRAEQLADIENSDFVGFSEKIALLNESYTAVYQKLVNRGDDAFIKILETNKDQLELPQDFFQLKSINILNNPYMITQVLRRPANQSTAYLSYDLRGNTLVINGHTQGGTVRIEYYPVPDTLTFPSPKIPIDSDDILAMNSTLYVVKDSDTKLILKDLNDPDIYVEITIAGTLKNVHMESDGIVIVTSTNLYFYNFLTSGKVSLTDSVAAIYKGKTFEYKNNNLYFIGTGRIAYAGVTFDVSEAKLIAISDEMDKFVGIEDTSFIAGNDTTHSTVTLKADVTNFSVSKGVVYILTGTDYLAMYTIESARLYETLKDSAIIDVVGFNDNTGYGFLTKKMGICSVESFFDDTRLNFPNNFYFTLIAYHLAIAFKSKQGSDSSQLMEMASRAEDTFYDTLTRDDWGSIRITNAY